MKLNFTLLLIFLSITILFSKEFEITSKIKENPAHLGLQMLDDKVKYDNNGELCALLIVRCGVKDINFSNTASKVAQIDKQGEYYITMKKGARYIVLKKDGFGSFKEQFGIVLKSGSVYEMSVDEKFKQATQIPVMITCNQNGAEVFVDGKLKGKIANKMLTTNIDNGFHKIKIKKDGFAPQEINKNISADNNSFDFKLIPAMPAAVTINTKPEGAIVYIDNIKFGTTPKSSFFDAGTYPIRIEKENYETINEQITISEPETKKNYNLADIRATLTIKTHKNATVSFDGNSYKGGVNNQKISPQVLEITVTMPKAETIKRVITLKPKTNETIEIYPEVQTGTIQVMTIPTTAKIELKGDGGEHYTATGRKTFIDVPVGTYELIVKADGHKTHKESFKVNSDKTTRKQVMLEEGSNIKDYTSKTGIEMIAVEGGTFQMGSINGDNDEKPVHSVTVDDFYIGKYEVTQKEWKEIMGNNPSNWKGDNLPVESVSWYDAVAFCNKLSEKEGLTPCYTGSGKNIKCNFSANGYRLPTEAEWEYVARGGVKTQNSASQQYAGSNNIDEVAWYNSNSGRKTHAVGGKKNNELGIYDMSGNVWEWCWDRYDSSYYKNSPTRNPKGASSGSFRVNRGGCWDYSAKFCRVANRSSSSPGNSSSILGFRLARTP